MLGVFGRAGCEDVQIACAEDECVQGLCDQRHALGAAVAVHGPDQDELGRRVRNVAQQVEEVELHLVQLLIGAC